MNNAASHLIWSPNPIIFSIGPLDIRWYSMCFLAAFLCGYTIMEWVYKKESKPLADLEPLFTYMFIGTIVGARLGHCLFYEPDFYFSNPLEIIKIWHGGLASHGGAIGILLALYFFCKKHKEQPYLWLLSRMSLAVCLAGCLIRLGNFFNSEIIGRQSDVAWAIVFSRVDNIPRHPSMLYESFAYLALFALLTWIYKKQNYQSKPSFLFGLFLTLLFSARFLVEFSKEPQALFEQSMILNMGQLLSLPMIAVGIYLLKRKN